MADEIEVPYFLCPIALDIMKDPVTISTGITYDRDSIEKWIFSQKNNTVRSRTGSYDTEASSRDEVSEESLSELRKACEEALSILYGLQLSESSLKSLTNDEFVEALTRAMQSGSYESRAYAVMLLQSMLEAADPAHILIKIKAVEAGAVPVLIDLLLESSDKRACEMTLKVLDLLCQCAEGRAELLKHGAGLAIVSKKILRVSQVASERAVRILHSVSKFSATPGVLQEMLQIGVVAKLGWCFKLIVDPGRRRDPGKCLNPMQERGGILHACLTV
ncbi:UNVERIFIED_CONTAM: E3 ubiquitin-protein ligase PUB23 [Sesamum latifolium]|uniref:U-box domain-containing protein n=1 Tax=Sesamum latifolium TaxID=2727402 RepID=A0AAW2U041_9LAMI